MESNRIVVENSKNNFYGITPTYPTWWSLRGRAISYKGTLENRIIEDFIELTPNFKKKNKAMIFTCWNNIYF